MERFSELIKIISDVPKSETFVTFIKIAAATWSINKIILVYIALESDTHHLTLKKDSVRFEKSNERKINKKVDPRDRKLFKILLLGDSGVGKTAIWVRYAEQKYGIDGEGSFLSSTGMDFKNRTLERKKGNVKLQIWDTGGQERYRLIAEHYYRLVDTIIIVYSVTDRSSFENLG